MFYTAGWEKKIIILFFSFFSLCISLLFLREWKRKQMKIKWRQKVTEFQSEVKFLSLITEKYLSVFNLRRKNKLKEKYFLFKIFLPGDFFFFCLSEKYLICSIFKMKEKNFRASQNAFIKGMRNRNAKINCDNCVCNWNQFSPVKFIFSFFKKKINKNK